MDNKELQAIHDEIWAQIYERQKKALEQQSKSTHTDMCTPRPQPPDEEMQQES